MLFRNLKYILLFLVLSHNAKSQSCQAAFNYTSGPGLTDILLIDNSTGVGYNTHYTWIFGGASTPSVSGANLTSVMITFTNSGIQSVTLVIANPVTSCSSAVTQTVGVPNYTTLPSCLLHANFSFTASAFNTGHVNFNTAATGSTGTTFFSWKFHDGSTAFGANAVKVFPTGTYTAMMIANSGSGCQDSIVRTYSVTNNCNIQFTTTASTATAGCNGSAQVTSVSPTCGTPNYTWSNGSTGASVSNLCPGTYTVFTQTGPLNPNCCSVIMATVGVASGCNINAGFNYFNGAAGTVSFSSTSTGTVGGSTFFWAYGDGGTGTGITSVHNYSSNAIYTVTLTVMNGTNCAGTFQSLVTVNNICTLNASFFSYPGGGGAMNFFSTSTGTNPSTTYTWKYGDSTTLGPCICPTPAHTYSVNGIYTTTLTVSNGVNCLSSATQSFVIDSLCTLQPGMTYTPASNWVVNFTSAFSGTVPGTIFSWNFGDGTNGSGPTASHSYSANGNYNVRLTAINGTSPLCMDSVIQQITVNSSCNLLASFTHTVGSSGNVHYQSTSSGTNSATLFSWQFGDGYGGNGSPVSHGYSNGGAHLVRLVISDPVHTTCADTVIQSVNITGVSCSANSGFTLVPTTVPKFWNAIPDYPWNVMAARWDWGDGSGSNQLYTSHQYSASATYSICLSVTVSCGSSNNSCAQYLVYKSQELTEMDIININVVPPAIKPVAVIEENKTAFAIFPNPNNGTFRITHDTKKETRLMVYDLTGKIAYSALLNPGSSINGEEISTGQLQNGIYFISIDGERPVKMIINK